MKLEVALPAFFSFLFGVLRQTWAYSSCSAGGSCNAGCSSAGMKGDEPIVKVLSQHSGQTFFRPGHGEGTATVVDCDIYINSFDSINVGTMDYSVNIYMRQYWRDERLAYAHLYPNISRFSVDHRLFNDIWVPDLFFPNEKQASPHCVTVPNAMIRLYPNGSIMYSSRYTLKLACHMDLHKFPLDEQECYMRVESYAYTDDEIQLHWRDDPPVQVNEMLELPQFDLVGITVGECQSSYVVGSFACLQVTFKLERQYGYFMIQTYIPSLLIVILSWVSFWISIDAVPARISLGVLTVLTLTTQSIGVWMSLPQVSYVKAIDIWMAMCIFMVFAAMLEFAIVNTNARKEIRRMSVKARQQDKCRTPEAEFACRVQEYTGTPQHRWDPNSRLIARRVDKFARWGFPGVFIAFNIIYWSLFLVR